MPLNNRYADAGRVSVVIPAYNAAAHLAATLESVFAQSAKPGEIIVVNDGSSDDTVTIARSLGVTVISIENGGPSAARNAGTRAATGDYVAYLDADDLWAPHKLAAQIAALNSYCYPAFSFTDYQVFDDAGIHTHRSELLREGAFRSVVGAERGRDTILITAAGGRPVLRDTSCYILPSSVLARRADVLAAGGFDETLRVCEDYEFFLRLFRSLPAIAVMKPLLFYRRHAEQASAAPIAMTQGLFEVEHRVVKAPDRYPTADVRNIATRGFLLHYRAGMWYTRLGRFDEAIESLKLSLAARRTLRAGLLLSAARFGRGAFGRSAFSTIRAIWKSRPRRRHSSTLE